MAMSAIWTAMVVISILCGLGTGRTAEVAAGAVEGAAAAVELCLAMAGLLCLWMGVMEIMKRSGLSEKLSALLRPILGRLYPDFAGDRAVMDAISANVSANLLGLGNAATPLGLAAIQAMAERNPSRESPTRGMVLFVVMNTASLQLIPLNMAAMRQSAGSAQPFAILPAVWITSAASLAVCLAACKLLERSPLWQR